MTLVGVLNGTSSNCILDALLLAFVDLRPSRITSLCCGQGSCSLSQPSSRCRPSFDPLPRFDRDTYRRLSGITIRDTLIGVLRPLLKTQTPVKATRPTASFQSGRKERTQRSPTCGPFASHSDPQGDLHLARGFPPGPSTAPRISASLEGSEPTLERAPYLRLARGHPSA